MLSPREEGGSLPAITQELLDQLFKYHAPEGDQPERYDRINAAAKALAQAIFENCPPSADTTHAIRQVRDARMWANAAIALKGAL